MLKILKEIFDIGHEIGHNKQWYYSKTLWVNVATLIGLVATKISGVETSEKEIETLGLGLLAIANITLRITTKRALKK